MINIQNIEIIPTNELEFEKKFKIKIVPQKTKNLNRILQKRVAKTLGKVAQSH